VYFVNNKFFKVAGQMRQYHCGRWLTFRYRTLNCRRLQNSLAGGRLNRVGSSVKPLELKNSCSLAAKV